MTSNAEKDFLAKIDRRLAQRQAPQQEGAPYAVPIDSPAVIDANDDIEAMDVVRAAKSGAWSGLAGLAEISERLFGKGEDLQAYASGAAKENIAAMSPGAKVAKEKPVFKSTGDKWYNVGLGEGAYDLGTLIIKGAEVAGGQVPTLVPGVGLTKGLQMGLRATGATGKTVVAGKVVNTPRDKLVDKGAAMVGYGTSEGASAAGSAALNVREAMDQVPDEDIAKVPAFIDSYYKIVDTNKNISHVDAFAQARKMVTDRAESDVVAGVGTSTFVLGAMLGPMYDKLFGGELKGGIIRKGLTVGAGEAATEIPQSSAEAKITGDALTKFGGKPELRASEILAQGLEGGVFGAATGGATGAVMGGIDKFRSPKTGEKPPAGDQGNADVPPPPDIDDQDLVDQIKAQMGEDIEPSNPAEESHSMPDGTIMAGETHQTVPPGPRTQEELIAAIRKKAEENIIAQRESQLSQQRDAERDAAYADLDRRKNEERATVAEAIAQQGDLPTMMGEALRGVTPETKAQEKKQPDILNEKGQPFQSRQMAELYAKVNKIQDAAPVNVGVNKWILRRVGDGISVENERKISPEEETELSTLLKSTLGDKVDNAPQVDTAEVVNAANSLQPNTLPAKDGVAPQASAAQAQIEGAFIPGAQQQKTEGLKANELSYDGGSSITDAAQPGLGDPGAISGRSGVTGVAAHSGTPMATGRDDVSATVEPANAKRALITPDRRKDTATRKLIDEMTPEEMRALLKLNPLTGLGSRLLYEENESKFPVQGAIDADSLKWINDNMSPGSGDKMLKAVADAIKDVTDNGFHIGGDEYFVLGKSQEEIDAIAEKVQSRLKNAVIRVEKPDGSIIEKRGIEVTHGTGQDKDTAEYALKQRKVEREKSGLRAGRGEQPPGVSKIPPAGKQDTERGITEEVDQQTPVPEKDSALPDAIAKMADSMAKMADAVDKVNSKVDAISKESAQPLTKPEAKEKKGDVSTKQEKVSASQIESGAVDRAWDGRKADAPMFSREQMPDTLNIDGVERPTRNSKGQLIHQTEEGVRNFWEWFGDSKVVDEQGRPLVVYHGTDSARDKFDTRFLGRVTRGAGTRWGFFFAEDKDHAEYWAKRAGGTETVEEVYLRIADPADISAGDDGGATLEYELDEKLMDSDHDGAYINDMQDDDSGELRNSWLALEPDQIKSATANTGAFSPSNANILFSRSPVQTPVLDHDAVEAIASGIFKKLGLGRNINLAVHPSEAALPPEILAAAREQGAEGEINAVYWRNKVHIVSSQMKSATDVETAIFHEALGHYGARALFGKEWGIKATQLYLAMGGEKGVRDFARKAGVNMDAYFKSAQRMPDNAEKALYLVDELLAHMQGNRATMSLPQRAVDAVKALIGEARQWLSRNGFMELSKLTDYDLAALLKRMRESATQAKDMAGKDAPLFSRSTTADDTMGRDDVAEKDIARALNSLANGFTRDQLVEMYSEELPSLNTYKEMQEQRETERTTLLLDDDRLHNKMLSLPSEQMDSLADIAAEATLSGYDPANPKEPESLTELKSLAESLRKRFKDTGKLTEPQMKLMIQAEKRIKEAPIKHAELQKRYDALSGEAKNVYVAARDKYRDKGQKVFDAVRDRINRMNLPDHVAKKAIEDMRVRFDKMLTGVYFPLARFGNNVVSGTQNGKPVVEYYESEREARRALDKMKADGITDAVMSRKKENTKIFAQNKALDDIVKIISESASKAEDGLPSEALELLLDNVNQALIRAAPDMSYRRHWMHRKGVPGYSRDFIRAFADSMSRSASHISNIMYNDRIHKAIVDMEKEADNAAPELRHSLQDIVNHFKKREEELAKPVSRITSAIGQISFISALGSISSGMVNLTQLGAVTMPYLMARYGAGAAIRLNADFATTINHITKALGKTGLTPRKFGESLDITTAMKEGVEKRLMTKLYNMDKINRTFALDLINAANHPSEQLKNSKSQRAIDTVMLIAAIPQHVSEVANRVTTALSVIKLEMAKSGNEEKALLAAIEAIDKTHFNYGAENRALVMHGNVARVVTMFKQYAQNMAYLWGRTAWLAVKDKDPETRRIARKQMAYMAASQSLIGGILGLPLGVEAAGVAGGMIGFKLWGSKGAYAMGITSAIAAGMLSGGWDDDDEDMEIEFRKAMVELATTHLGEDQGKAVAEIVSRGAFRMIFPGDIAGRVDQSELFIRKPDPQMEGQDAYYAWLTSALGYTVGYGAQVAQGAKLINDGEVYRGVEKIIPVKQVRDAMKAYRYETEGTLTLKGDNLLSESDPNYLKWHEITTQAVGFTPRRLAESYEGNTAVRRAEKGLTKQRQYIMDDLKKAYRKGDQAAIDGAYSRMGEFFTKNPSFYMDVSRSLEADARDRGMAEGGLVVNPKHGEIKREGEFANR